MDVLCKFLSSDLSCLLKNIFSSIGFGSSTSDRDEDFAIKNVQMNVEDRRHTNKSRLVTRPSYTIRHHYPGPLITYDGEERCEPRLIRFSDLSCSKVEEILRDCKDEDDDNEECIELCEEDHDPNENCGEQYKPCSEVINACKKEPSPCEFICQKESQSFPENQEKGCQTSQSIEDCCLKENSEDRITEKSNAELMYLVRNLFPKRICRLNAGKEESSETSLEGNSPKEEEVRDNEDRARAIYENQIGPFGTSWESLKPAEKLRFQWKAFTGDELKECPYDNFRDTFNRNFRKTNPWATGRTVKTERRTAWSNLERCQRMPFILQSLLYQVTIGAIDPEDHCAVRELFHKLR
ncbi:uncharacterized protein LOC108046001 [Drosophila rhopaloa]|uniref:Uncharacterized protein n=1 Tax=Drosophila rhopaloa TaxID=1041015 RepID=A0ABM5HIT3_DRORH|nr:uncharacterized protein LOC108046001 [Drosophila rhopaloa]